MCFFSAEERSCGKGFFCTRVRAGPASPGRDGDGGGTAGMPCGHPRHKKKAPRNSVSSTWILARATPAPSNDPFMPGKCNGEFLQPSPAPDSHQVSEGRRGADRTPCCRVTHLAHRLLRGILVAGRWHVAPAGATPWAGVLHRPWPWAPPARCCPPAWPGPAATVSTRAHLMCLQGERGGDIMASSGREGGAASALLCTAMAPQWPPGIQLHRL